MSSPAFGQADLSNCERELIHLPGSIQPHGLLLALQEPGLRIVQASRNVGECLGVAAEDLVGQMSGDLGDDLAAGVRQAVERAADLAEPVPLCCTLLAHGRPGRFEGSLHRVAGGLLLVELEPVDPARSTVETVDIPGPALDALLAAAVQRFSEAPTIGTLADGVVRCFRDVLGYDRVMVYQFDPDGHGKIIAEARDPRLDSLLGHHYPASDIPQRARELYVRNRLRVLVDVHGEPSPLVPRLSPGTGEELDMSMCQLRSMSPLHLQYLKNMGVTATLVVSLVREGRLWGLIACHHDVPRHLRCAVRAAADLLAEVIVTRIAAIEHDVHAQVAVQVRRLEQRLVEATSTEGDWRLALFRNPRAVLQPLDATGAALFHDGELLTAGEVPATAGLRALLQWVDGQAPDGFFSCASVSKANPAFDALTPTASGVLAVKLSAAKPDYLMWFRKEQLSTVTWAGDPSKPVVGDDPTTLSPRRSFAAWSEIVRATAVPWSASELALGRAFGAALVDIIVQVNAVRLLIAEHQITSVRANVDASGEAVVIGDATGRLIFANEAFLRLRQQPVATGSATLADLFADAAAFASALASLVRERRPWRGRLDLRRAGDVLPVDVRAEVVPARDGSVIGFFLVVDDLTNLQRASDARRQLERSLARVGDGARRTARVSQDEVMNAILANASLAAMDIADSDAAPAVAPLFEELELSAHRAALLHGRIRRYQG